MRSAVAARAIAQAMTKKTHVSEKLLQRTARFCRNVTFFAGDLSKTGRQLTLLYAIGVTSSIPTIFN
jgi:hypothetical protein